MYLTRVGVFLILSLLLSFNAFSQALETQINKFIEAKEYNEIIKLAEAFYNVKDDSIIAIAEKKLIRSNDLFLQICGLQIKGNALYNKDNLPESKKIMLQLDTLYSSNAAAIPDLNLKWRIFIRLFYIERRLGNYQKAMELTERAEKTDTGSTHNYKMLYAVNDMDLGYFDRAIALFKEAIASGKTDGNTLPNMLNNIGDGYRKYYNKTGRADYLDSALACYEKSYLLAKDDTVNLPYTNALLLLRRGKIGFLKNRIRYAMEQYRKGIEMPFVKQKPFILQEFELGIADCCYSISQYRESNEHLNAFYENYKLFPSYKENLISAYYLSSQNYEKLNNSSQSLYYAKLCLEESGQLGENKKLANELLHNKTLKDLENDSQKIIRSQKSKNGVLLVVGSLLFICILFMFLYIRQTKVINISKNNELKQRLLLTQMNPHFIFNSIDNIQSLIYNKQDKEAINYLTKFSKLTRQILENSRENYISLSEELSMLNNYLTIQMLLYNDKFTFSIEAPGIDPEAVYLPPMLTQPFIENAVKHGLKNKTEGGIIKVRFCMKEGMLFFEVTDNGSGLESKGENSLQKSLSTQIAGERLDNISLKKKIMIRTLNTTTEDGQITGAKTCFEIPFIFNN